MKCLCLEDLHNLRHWYFPNDHCVAESCLVRRLLQSENLMTSQCSVVQNCHCPGFTSRMVANPEKELLVKSGCNIEEDC